MSDVLIGSSEPSECAGCMSKNVKEYICPSDCSVINSHRHMYCKDCNYFWTES